MLAAIPYFGLGVYNIPIPGTTTSIPLDPWAILVCIGFVVGLEIGRARAVKLGMEVRDIVDGAVFTVGMGFLIGHIVTVVFYQPWRLGWGTPPSGEEVEGIWAILRFWTGFSSIGGFLGAIIGSVLFYGFIRPRPYWRYADVISYGFPFGWFFGRLGCASVHDHIGKVTDFPLAMDFDHGYHNFSLGRWVQRVPDGTWMQLTDPHSVDGIRHELGLYEAIYIVPVLILWWFGGKRDWPPGTVTAGFFLLYAPVRFGLDFLRNTDLSGQDPRYFYLTAAQWGCVALAGGCIAVLATRDWKNFKPWPLDGKPNQAERALAMAGNPGGAPGVESMQEGTEE